MYTSKQLKNETGNRVSRQVECGKKQRMQIRDGKKNVMNISNIIQTYQVSKVMTKNGNTADLITIGKAMKSAADKVDFYKFMESKNETNKDFSSLDKDYILKSESHPERKGYYEGITESYNTANYWINWPANCTGDLPSMSTAILMGFKHGINIARYGNIHSQSRLNEVSAYLGGVIDKGDDHFIINNDGWKGTYDKNIGNGLKFSWLTRVVATGKYKDDKTGIEEVVKETGYEKKDEEKVRNVWLGECNVDKKIEKFLNSYSLTFEKLKGKKITVLWIRKSGERGGAHFENDTSFKALKYYIKTHDKELIVLAGDKKGTKTNDLQKIAPDRVYDLTEFWNMQGVAEWGGNTRTGQLRLYDYLDRNGSLTHIGSMSGGLEALALIGHNVNFKAKEGESGVSRMKQYQENHAGINYNQMDFHGNHRYFDYKGFEKSAAKYFVFFGSGVVKAKATESSLMYLYNTLYNPNKSYKIYKNGLNAGNAKVAYAVSKKLAKEEKLTILERKRKKSSEQREIKSMIDSALRDGNPNRKKIKNKIPVTSMRIYNPKRLK